VEAVRDFLNTGKGKVLTYAAVAAAAVLLLIVLRGTLGESEAAAQSKNRIYICAETGKPFDHELKAGDTVPLMSPHSGKQTGFPAELCYWTADGKIKDKPTPVLLNEYVGKSGYTYCPDCGRRVTAHNRRPNPGDDPPPTSAGKAK
jgi:hypothetical protein